MNNIEYLLAKRTAQSDRASRGGVMMRIAAVSVALGLTVMIVALAVVGGFKRDLYDDFRGFAADVQIFNAAIWGRNQASEPLPECAAFAQAVRAIDGIEWVAPYVEAVAMVRSDEHSVGLTLKGITPEYNTDWWQSRVVEGELPDVAAERRGREVMLSRTTARALDVGIGDKLELLAVESSGSPRRTSFKVVGIYHTGLEEMDRTVALADLRDVRSLVGWHDNEISGYDVMVTRQEQATSLANQIDRLLVEEDFGEQTSLYVPATLYLRYPIVFDWLKAHTVIARVVIIIMMAVLLFNMAAAMLIMVFDRIGMIGVLKAQGMRNAAIRRLFLYRSALLFLRGAVWGNLIGIAAVVVQSRWQIIGLDPDGYMLSHLPVELGWWVVWLNIGVGVATVAVMVIPSMVVARIRPEESLKYKL